MMEVRVCSYKDNPIGNVINTTSRSENWSKGLSPFFLGPVQLWGSHTSQNVENAWQYSKVYPGFTDELGHPSKAWYDWACEGWSKSYAERYPLGKGKVPLYLNWDGHKLDYLTARRLVYCPLYACAVWNTDAFKKLQYMYHNGEGILWLKDFDGYDHKGLGLSYEAVLNSPRRKMGHAFVLAMLLENKRLWEKPETHND